MTSEIVAEQDVVLCVCDTTFLDYDSIVENRVGYGPIGRGGNGLILHSALAIDPQKGQFMWYVVALSLASKDQTKATKR